MTPSLHPAATAFGKVILVAEHAVVYGVPALAAGLPDSLRLEARPLDDRHAPIEVRIPAWDVDLRLEAASENTVARACLEVLAFCDGPVTGWAIEGHTVLPPRAGLGSSAALTVGIARLALGSAANVQDVVAASLAGERLFHGNPSGIDSEVAARGGVLRYVRTEGIERVEYSRPLPLCVVPSGVARSTADQVAKVRARHDRLPSLQRPALELMGVATAEAIAAIQAADWPRLGEIFDVCQGLLAAVGVSSRPLDDLCGIAREHGALGAKLTGGGGGGCILAIPPDPVTPLVDGLRASGRAPLLIEV
jgi:mevalonate kinase